MKRKAVPGPTFDVLEDARTMVEKLRILKECDKCHITDVMIGTEQKFWYMVE